MLRWSSPRAGPGRSWALRSAERGLTGLDNWIVAGGVQGGKAAFVAFEANVNTLIVKAVPGSAILDLRLDATSPSTLSATALTPEFLLTVHDLGGASAHSKQPLPPELIPRCFAADSLRTYVAGQVADATGRPEKSTGGLYYFDAANLRWLRAFEDPKVEAWVSAAQDQTHAIFVGAPGKALTTFAPSTGGGLEARWLDIVDAGGQPVALTAAWAAGDRVFYLVGGNTVWRHDEGTVQLERRPV